MSLFLTAPEIAIAKESIGFWMSKGAPRMQAFSLAGCEGGETGFIWKIGTDGKPYTPPGDNGKARGPFQHWPARGQLILTRTGFDVRFGDHLEALKGAFAEMTESWSPYKHVWSALMAATTWWGCQNELVEFYEQSKNQASDDVKRVAIAMYLDHQLPEGVA